MLKSVTAGREDQIFATLFVTQGGDIVVSFIVNDVIINLKQSYPFQ